MRGYDVGERDADATRINTDIRARARARATHAAATAPRLRRAATTCVNNLPPYGITSMGARLGPAFIRAVSVKKCSRLQKSSRKFWWSQKKFLPSRRKH